jgi:hypothetical protein
MSIRFLMLDRNCCDYRRNPKSRMESRRCYEWTSRVIHHGVGVAYGIAYSVSRFRPSKTLTNKGKQEVRLPSTYKTLRR